ACRRCRPTVATRPSAAAASPPSATCAWRGRRGPTSSSLTRAPAPLPPPDLSSLKLLQRRDLLIVVARQRAPGIRQRAVGGEDPAGAEADGHRQRLRRRAVGDLAHEVNEARP